MLQLGKFNTRVTIQQRTTAVDALGQPLPDGWETHLELWAHVLHQAGAEAIKAGAPVSTVAASIRVHWTTGIDADMRVLIGAVVYEILAVMPDLQRREFVDLVCQVVA